MLEGLDSTHRCYRFGPFRFDTCRQQLYRDEQPVKLPRRVARTLHLLLEHRGRDLDKNYLMGQLWPNTVVEENNLTVIISMLRKVLGDDLEHKKYILTNPGRGYRFVADVSEVGSDDQAGLASIPTPAAIAVGPAPATTAEHAPSTIAEHGATSRRVFPRFFPQRMSGAKVVLAIGLVALLALLGAREWSKRSVTQTIAVLPFRSVGAERDGYLGLGMADALVARLRSIRHVVVRPTTDVIKYQRAAYDPRALARDLHVSSLLDGMVQTSGDQVSIRVKLTRAEDGAILWSNEYHGRSADILTLQDRIAEQAARALALKLDSAEQESIHRHYASSTDAYLKYMAGRYYCGENDTERSLRQGIALFEEATAMDAQFALAQASLATCYEELADGVSDSRDWLVKAKVAAERALEIDWKLPEAHLARALAFAYYDWDFVSAEGAFRRSIDLQPEDPTTHLAYARFLITQSRIQEAEQEAKKGADLAPFSWDAYAAITEVYFFGHRYQQAAQRWERLGANGLDEGTWYLPWIYAAQGKSTPASDALLKAKETKARQAAITAELAYIRALQGMKAQAESYLQELAVYQQENDDYEIALVYAALGEQDRALELLASARDKRNREILYLNIDPRLESLRSDPRFTELLRSMHLLPE